MAGQTPKSLPLPDGSTPVRGGAEVPFMTIVPVSAALRTRTARFFDDAEAFASLARDVFPLLTRRRSAGETLRVWVPGCSTGEEAYSIAIAYSEFCADAKCDVPLHVVGTDVDAGRIEAARRGIYGQTSLAGVSAVRRERFFSASGDRWRIVKALRDRCTFLQHDLLAAPALSGADLVSFREIVVLRENRGEVLEKLREGLRAGGVLWLGTADGRRELSGPGKQQRELR